MKSEKEIVEITLSFPGGFGEGKVSSTTNTLVRPFRILIDEGRNVGRINYLFYRENGFPSRIFGALCCVLSKRLLFFPGLAGRRLLWHSKTPYFIPPGGLIDHFTIEPNFQTWHVTTLINGEKEKRKNWIPSFKLFEIQPKVYFWFGLSMREVNQLELTPAITNLPLLKGNPEDLQRKVDIVMRSRKGAKFQGLLLPNGEKFDSENNFLHFDVLIDKRQFRWLNKLDLKSVAPFGEPALIEEINPDLQFIARTHRVKVRGFNGDIIIGVSQHRGKLKERAIITNPEI